MLSQTEIVTFGCRLNAYESEVIRKNLDSRTKNVQIIFNTCAVTKEAERQARQAIRKARRENPHAQIIVTGCAAQIDPEKYASMPQVDRVIGNIEKLDPATYGINAPIVVNDIMSVREISGHLIQGFANKARAFIQVQQGCSHRCTFCIIPFGRGNSRSVPIGHITQQVNKLVSNGYLEIVLSGVDISSYGSDLPGRPNLGQMVRRLLANAPNLKRLRISSIDCSEIDHDLKKLIATEERLMPHFHLSLQSGDDLILKRMKRRHSRAEAIALCSELKELRPDIVLGADLITGFPTETEEMFQNTLALVNDCGLTWLHVFPYSERSQTTAARMPQVPVNERKKRAARLRKAGETAVSNHLKNLIGTVVEVLMETPELGRTIYFTPVKIDNSETAGTLIKAYVKGINGNGHLYAQNLKCCN